MIYNGAQHDSTQDNFYRGAIAALDIVLSLENNLTKEPVAQEVQGY